MPTSPFSDSSDTPSNQPTAEALDRFFIGESAPAERTQIETALAQSPAVSRALNEEQSLVPSADTLWASFESRRWTEKPASAKPSRWKTLGIGSAVALAAGVAIAVTWPSFHSTNLLSGAATYSTISGQTSEVQLAPGINATLAPETQLHYHVTSSGAAVAQLEGEAYFNVTAATNRPFTVRTGEIETRVLGTAFNVRRYLSDATTQVSVISGKVSVQSRDREKAAVIVTPGMIAAATDSVAHITSTVGAQNTIAWIDGRLVFDNVAVPQMLSTLGKWYGLRFTYTDSVLATKRVSTTVVVERSQETLAILKDLLDVSMEFQDSVVVLRTNAGHRGADSSSQPPTRKTVVELPTRAGK